jgi:hypothetical protein
MEESGRGVDKQPVPDLQVEAVAEVVNTSAIPDRSMGNHPSSWDSQYERQLDGEVSHRSTEGAMGLFEGLPRGEPGLVHLERVHDSLVGILDRSIGSIRQELKTIQRNLPLRPAPSLDSSEGIRPDTVRGSLGDSNFIRGSLEGTGSEALRAAAVSLLSRTPRNPQPAPVVRVSGRGGRGNGRGGRGSTETPRVSSNARDPDTETGKGSTKRNAFRKARKGVADTFSGDFPTYFGALARLARLQIRWSVDTSHALGDLPTLYEDVLRDYEDVLTEIRKNPSWTPKDKPSE